MLPGLMTREHTEINMALAMTQTHDVLGRPLYLVCVYELEHPCLVIIKSLITIRIGFRCNALQRQVACLLS